MDDIPNQDLIFYLLRDYYGDAPPLGEDKFISSHWQHYSKFFDVKVDKQGNLISISGQAFGKLKWSNLADKIFDQATIVSHLIRLPHKRDLLRLMDIAVQKCNAMGVNPTLDVFRQVCSLELLQRNLPAGMRRKPIRVLMIGDGYGVLSALFKQVYPNATMVLVDLGKTLLFQAYYCQKAHPGYHHEIVTKVDNLDGLDFVYCPADKLERLEAYKFDIAVNINSMQEMNSATVSNYFAFLRKCLKPDNLFYCCNRESKTLIGGEVLEFFHYPWKENDTYLIDESCPWQQYYFSKTHSEKGMYFLGIRIPFVNLYSGRHIHRLAILATN